MEQLPELKGVRDMTDHSDTSQAYINVSVSLRGAPYTVYGRMRSA